MDSLLENRLSNLTKACAGIALALTTVCPSHAVIVVTSDPAVAAAFQSGAALELFDDLTAFPITSYGPGQTIDPGAKFSSRDGATQPTYHSGGASFNNPVGNPGTPIGIFHPQGGIAADVVSSPNVAGPLVINSDEPFNNGFMEVIFPDEVGLVGFWVTSGGLSLTLRDNTGSDLTGDFSATVTAGQFVGISRDNSDVKIAALLGNGTDHFTIDDFTYRPAGSPSSPGVPEGGSVFTLALAAGFLCFTNRRFNLERRRASKNV
jgi:hypothetical protein